MFSKEAAYLTVYDVNQYCSGSYMLNKEIK